MLAVLGALLPAAVAHWDWPTITGLYYIGGDLRSRKGRAMGGAGERLLRHCSTAVKGASQLQTGSQGKQNPLEAGALALFAYHSNKSVVNLVTARGS